MDPNDKDDKKHTKQGSQQTDQNTTKVVDEQNDPEKNEHDKKADKIGKFDQ